mmetsp:Transcript_27527/g.59158  ORF Transcript_27527/g.59158 Transcript_27527/m.59158 type:complete len:214 (-) Transcript_27527:651-1292(-)
MQSVPLKKTKLLVAATVPLAFVARGSGEYSTRPGSHAERRIFTTGAAGRWGANVTIPPSLRIHLVLDVIIVITRLVIAGRGQCRRLPHRNRIQVNPRAHHGYGADQIQHDGYPKQQCREHGQDHELQGAGDGLPHAVQQLQEQAGDHPHARHDQHHGEYGGMEHDFEIGPLDCLPQRLLSRESACQYYKEAEYRIAVHEDVLQIERYGGLILE